MSTEEKRTWLLKVYMGWIASKDYASEFWMAKFQERISAAEEAWIDGLWEEVHDKVPDNWK